MRLIPNILLNVLALLLASVSARADLAFVLTPPAQSGVGTNEIFFTGTLTNRSPATNYLNSIQFSLTNAAANYLIADTNAFFANVPGTMLPGKNYSDVVFGIFINPATPPGTYSGTVTIRGGGDIFATGNLTSQFFQVNLPPASLDIAKSDSNVFLSWPLPPGGFVLQQNSDLDTTNWTTAPETPAITNYLGQVTIAPTNGRQFYRLKYP